MRNTLKHLTLLTRMKDDGLLPALTGSFSEDAIAQACGQVETLQLQERLHIRKTKRIQEDWFGCRTLQRSMVRCAGRRLAMKKLLQS